VALPFLLEQRSRFCRQNLEQCSNTGATGTGARIGQGVQARPGGIAPPRHSLSQFGAT